jgi:hypothetical protein
VLAARAGTFSSITPLSADARNVPINIKLCFVDLDERNNVLETIYNFL